MTFTDDFLDFMPDTAYAQPGVVDGYGTFIPSGDQLSLQCRIEGDNHITRDAKGREVVSGVQIIVGGVYGLTADLHRYYIPSRYLPSGALVAVSVEREADEDGPCYEVVYLP